MPLSVPMRSNDRPLRVRGAADPRDGAAFPVGAVLLLGAALLFVGMGNAQAQTASVQIEKQLFSPAELTVKPGTTVEWTNHEKRTSHSILFTGPDGFESDRLFPGERWQRRFDEPGRYPYICGPHPEMHGVVIVAP